VLVLLLAVGAAVWSAKPRPRQAKPGRRPSQSQVGTAFLRAVLRKDYTTAYAQLAPEVRRGVSVARFQGAAQPLWQAGQHHGTALELYKLGVRLEAGGSSRLFYAYSFAADSSLRVPSVLLEVAFRDTATRNVLAFGIRKPAAASPGKPKPANSNPKR